MNKDHKVLMKNAKVRKERIQKLYLDGFSQSDIARKVDLTRQRVSQIIQRVRAERLITSVHGKNPKSEKRAA